MLKLKQSLLMYGFQDNAYLDEYVELMLNNHRTSAKTGSTQKHHVIPVSCYNNTTEDSTATRTETLREANSDENNYKVNLTYPDHIKAHYLLCQCSPGIVQKVHNMSAYVLMLHTLLPAVTAGIVSDLETPEQQQLAYEFVRANTPPSPGGFKPKSGTYATTYKTRHKPNSKVRCIETGVVYNSIKDAEQQNNLPKSRINGILSGHRKQIPGMTFEYVEDSVND